MSMCVVYMVCNSIWSPCACMTLYALVFALICKCTLQFYFHSKSDNLIH